MQVTGQRAALCSRKYVLNLDAGMVDVKKLLARVIAAGRSCREEQEREAKAKGDGRGEEKRFHVQRRFANRSWSKRGRSRVGTWVRWPGTRACAITWHFQRASGKEASPLPLAGGEQRAR